MADKNFRLNVEWIWAMLPAFTGVILVIILAELDIIEFEFSIHDVDTFIIFIGLLLTIGVSTILIARETIRQVQRQSDYKISRMFAEDRKRFLRRLDHEVKNPLMGIKTALDNLAETTDLEQQQQIRRAIFEQINRLNRLVTDLRKIGELDNHEIEQLPISMDMLLQDVFSLAKEDKLAAKHHLSINTPETLPQIDGDYDLLLLAIYNVIHNSIKYCFEGANIELKATCKEEEIEVVVSDTGPGISGKDLPYVWDELYRSENTKETSGSGIGLALVKRIMERHGGRAEITSQLGKGTTVYLILPRNHIA